MTSNCASFIALSLHASLACTNNLRAVVANGGVNRALHRDIWILVAGALDGLDGGKPHAVRRAHSLQTQHGLAGVHLVVENILGINHAGVHSTGDDDLRANALRALARRGERGVAGHHIHVVGRRLDAGLVNLAALA